VSAFAHLADALRAARTAGARPLRQFAAEDIVIPTGPSAGFRWTPEVQPYAALWFEQLELGGYRRSVATGPVQSGKTTIAFTIPVLYALFELNQAVIIGAPRITTLQDKWERDLRPMIEVSRFSSRLPRTGAGSAGGDTHIYYFGRGAVLRFMAGTGTDKDRASFTAQCAFLTEVDGMDEVKAGSRESDPVSQIEARTEAYADAARIGMECTVSHDKGRIWNEYQASTRSRIGCPCPHCGEWVTPERDHLVGWREARTEVEAGELARWACPACAAEIDDATRREMNRRAIVVHHGQEVVDGRAVGDGPKTNTLGFRWNAWNNLFVPTSRIAEGEWRALRSADPASAERQRMQFVWVVPIKLEEGPAEGAVDVRERVDQSLPRGVVPSWCSMLVLGADVGRYGIHWSAKAFAEDTTSHTVEYGVQDVQSAELGEERAILQALRALRDRAAQGWKTADGRRIPVLRMLVDSNYASETAHHFAHETRGYAIATMGRGAGQERKTYVGPKRKGSMVYRVGDHWHLEWVTKQQGRRRLLLFSTDYWKSRLSAKIRADRGKEGAWTVHAPATENEHHSFAKHLAAETATRQWDPRKGTLVETWHARRAQNHWLDAEVLGEVAAAMLGATPLRKRRQQPEESPPQDQAAPPPRPQPRRRSRISSPLLRR
jgi:phage terminase large subunit GpA-like protein